MKYNKLIINIFIVSENSHFCIFKEQNLLSETVELYDGFHVGSRSAELLYCACSEAVVLNSLACTQVGHW